MKKFVTISIITIIFLAVASIGAIMVLRMDEDSWVCENGEWVKHGNPESPVPETGCGEKTDGNSLPAQDESIIDENSNNVIEEPIVGGDKDEHGCIGSAGYTWCPEKNNCLRIWEEDCPSIPKTENN